MIAENTSIVFIIYSTYMYVFWSFVARHVELPSTLFGAKFAQRIHVAKLWYVFFTIPAIGKNKSSSHISHIALPAAL